MRIRQGGRGKRPGGSRQKTSRRRTRSTASRSPAARRLKSARPAGSQGGVRWKPDPYRRYRESLDEFFEEADRLVTVYMKIPPAKSERAQKESRAFPPSGRSRAVFGRELYSFLRSYIHRQGGAQTIKTIARNADFGTLKGPAYSENPFYLGVVAVFCESGVQPPALSKINLWANQMQYADRHRVPPCLFWGFLLQEGIMSGISNEEARGEDLSWTQEHRTLDFEIESSRTGADW